MANVLRKQRTKVKEGSHIIRLLLNGMKHHRSGILLTIILLLVISATIALSLRHTTKPVQKEIQTHLLKTIVLNKKKVADQYEIPGSIKTKNSSVISSRIQGSITKLSVRLGDPVKSGQELVVLENRDLVQRIAAAQAAYEVAVKVMDESREVKQLADIEYNRYKKLAAEKVITTQEMDRVENQHAISTLNYERAQSAVKRAEADVEESRSIYNYSRILSPVDGVIAQKLIDMGSMAIPGAPLLVIDDNSGFEVHAHVNEHDAEVLSIGIPIEVRVDAISAVLKTHVTELSPSIDTATRSFLMKAEIENDPNHVLPLKNGMYARMFLSRGEKYILAVPARSIVERGQLLGVYVEDQGVIRYRMIRTGKQYGDDREVLAGLREGERIVVDEVNDAVDGQANSVQSENNELLKE